MFLLSTLLSLVASSYPGIVWSLFESNFDARIEQDQLHEREQYILELEMKLNDKDRELNALKIDHQTVSVIHFMFCNLHGRGNEKCLSSFFFFGHQVWANQDLIREQTKELATVRYYIYVTSAINWYGTRFHCL